MAVAPPAIDISVLRQTVGPILRSSKRAYPRLLQQTPSRLPLAHPLAQFNRRSFIPSAPCATSKAASVSIGIEWYGLSTARKIQWLLSHGGDRKWGWVIYRTTYRPDLDRHWKKFKHLVNDNTRRSIARSDAPEIAEKLDWVFVEDPELDGITLNELKCRFRTWVRAETPSHDAENFPENRGSRYTFFIQVDEDALQSMLDDPNHPSNPTTRLDLKSGHVNIVRAWKDSLLLEGATDEFGEVIDNEDWMKMQASMIAPYFYVDLENDESWYAHYSPPPHGICVW